MTCEKRYKIPSLGEIDLETIETRDFLLIRSLSLLLMVYQDSEYELEAITLLLATAYEGYLSLFKGGCDNKGNPVGFEHMSYEKFTQIISEKLFREEQVLSILQNIDKLEKQVSNGGCCNKEGLDKLERRLEDLLHSASYV